MSNPNSLKNNDASSTESPKEDDSNVTFSKPSSTNLNKLIFQAAHKVAENQAKKTVNKAQAQVRVDLGVEKKQDPEADKSFREGYKHKHDLSIGNISLIESQTAKIIRALLVVGVFSLAIALIANKGLRDSISKQFSEARKVLDRGEKRDLNLVKAISDTYKSSALNKTSASPDPDLKLDQQVLNAKVLPNENKLSTMDAEISLIVNKFEEDPESFRSQWFQKFQTAMDDSFSLTALIEIVFHAISIRDWSFKDRFQVFLQNSAMDESQKNIFKAFLKIYEVAQISGPSQNQKILNEIEASINSVSSASSVVGHCLKKFLLLRSVFGFYSNQSVYNFDRNSLLQLTHIIHLAKKLIFLSDVLRPNFGENLDKFLLVPEYIKMLEKDSSMLKFVIFTSMRTKNYKALSTTLSISKNMLNKSNLLPSLKWKLNVWTEAVQLMDLNSKFKLDSWAQLLLGASFDQDSLQGMEILMANYILNNKFKSGLLFGTEVNEKLSMNKSQNILSILRRILIHIYQGEMVKAKALSDSLKPWMTHNYVFNWNQMLGFYAASRGDSQAAALKSSEAFLVANPVSPFVNLVKYYSLIELRRTAQAEAQLDYMIKNSLEFTNLSLVENLSSPYSIAHLF